MLNFDLIKNILVISIASSIVTTNLVQKIKESFKFKNSNRLVLVSFFVSMVLGTLFSLSFSTTNLINSLWVGLFSFIGADMLYKMFEDKLFKPFSQLYEKDMVEIPKENQIRWFMAVSCRVLKGGFCEITQYYGGDNNHLGIDIVGKNYTIDTVVAHSDGTVVFIQTNQVNNPGSFGDASYGNFVKINHGDGWFTLYAHLDTVNVNVGDKVSKGQVLGLMGNTGNSYGAHLHFEVWQNNARTNPYIYLDKELFELITQPVLKDETKDQLIVNVDDLRIRRNPSINSEILGLASWNGIYNYYEIKENEGYTWYKIDEKNWLAGNNEWVTIYPKINESAEIKNLQLEIETLKKQVNLLEQENKIIKENNEGFKIFVAPISGLYYIELTENENLIYKKVSE